MSVKQRVYYRIADFLIAIESDDEEKTAQLLPNFAPFRVKDKEATWKGGENLLFCLSCNESVYVTEDMAAEDDFRWNGIRYNVYRNIAGERIIRMIKNDSYRLLRADKNWSSLSADITLNGETEAEFLNNFLIVSFGMASARFRTVKLHASVIEKGGSALLFLGKSGTGKSTHSRLWQQYVPGCSLLNDDEPVVRINEWGEVTVYGTPWSGKTPCYRNEEARVAAFVLLGQSSENNLTKLSAKEAFFALFSSCSMLRSDVHYKNAVFDTVAAILERVPVYRLDCRPDREAVSLTETLLFS